MYICLCRGITDKQITAAMRNGASSCQALVREFGVGTQCGCCRSQVAEMVSEFRNAQTEETAAANPLAAAGIGLYRPSLATA